MVNFFGFYIDPVYILILTVALVSGFLVILGHIMLQMVASLKSMSVLLEKSYTELSVSEVTRVAREADRAVAPHEDTVEELKRQVAELKTKAEQHDHLFGRKSGGDD